jgi:hypothetical protein
MYPHIKPILHQTQSRDNNRRPLKPRDNNLRISFSILAGIELSDGHWVLTLLLLIGDTHDTCLQDLRALYIKRDTTGSVPDAKQHSNASDERSTRCAEGILYLSSHTLPFRNRQSQSRGQHCIRPAHKNQGFGYSTPGNRRSLPLGQAFIVELRVAEHHRAEALMPRRQTQRLLHRRKRAHSRVKVTRPAAAELHAGCS